MNAGVIGVEVTMVVAAVKAAAKAASSRKKLSVKKGPTPKEKTSSSVPTVASPSAPGRKLFRIGRIDMRRGSRRLLLEDAKCQCTCMRSGFLEPTKLKACPKKSRSLQISIMTLPIAENLCWSASATAG